MSHDCYRALFARHPGILLLVDARSDRIVDASDAAAALLGLRTEALLGTSFTELFVQETRSAAEGTNGLDAPGREPTLLRHVTARGTARLLEARSAHIDSPACRLIALQDVTDRASYPDTLEDYRTFFDQVPVAFYRATPGPEGRFLRVNPAMVRLFDADSAEHLQRRSIASLYIDAADR